MKTKVTVAMNVYFGTTHAHTGAENDHGQDSSTAGDVFTSARDNGWDFFMLTEHSGPTGPARPAAFYSGAQAQAEGITEAGTFVGLAGYEYSSNRSGANHGHLTVFGTNDFVSAMEPGRSFASFQDHLVEQDATREVFAGFNHPPAKGHAAARAALKTPKTSKVMALSGVMNGMLHQPRRELRYYRAYVEHLDRGWRVAPTCELDTHSIWGLSVREPERKPCRTGVLAPDLTREGIIDSILARRVYATRDTNLVATYSANGSWMGSRMDAPKRLTFDISVTDPNTGRESDAITKIQVVGPNRDVRRVLRVDSHTVRWRPTVTVARADYFFVLVFTDTDRPTAVLAPVWMR